MSLYAIDFGTSNSLLSHAYSEGVSHPLELDPDNTDPSVFRSLMFFPESGDASFGYRAIKEYSASSFEGRFFRSIKHFLPTSTFTRTRVGPKSYTLEELIARFLREMKSRADQQLQQSIDRLLLGRPARFSMNSRDEELAQSRLHQAAKLAGFKEVHFFEEPLAAAYDFKQELQDEKIVLVVDLGGGTSDFTVLRLGPKDFRQEDVLSLGGISKAGDALDGEIMTRLISHYFGSEIIYRLPMGKNILKMPLDLKRRLSSTAEIAFLSRSDLIYHLKDIQKAVLDPEDSERLENLFRLVEDNLGYELYSEIEKTKIAACSNSISSFEFQKSGIQLSCKITEKQFNAVTKDCIHRIMETLDQTISDAGLGEKQINLICLTGGSSKVPVIHEQLKVRFGSDKIQSRDQFHSVIKGLGKRAKELI